jgi:hypothetical protein
MWNACNAGESDHLLSRMGDDAAWRPYVGLPKEASNQVSGIINLVRNVYGSIFIAVIGAIVTNRSLFHQARLQEFMQPAIPHSSTRSTLLPLTSVVAEEVLVPASWHELPFISSSICMGER